jgi:hypothetical protein
MVRATDTSKMTEDEIKDMFSRILVESLIPHEQERDLAWTCASCEDLFEGAIDILIRSGITERSVITILAGGIELGRLVEAELRKRSDANCQCAGDKNVKYDQTGQTNPHPPYQTEG